MRAWRGEDGDRPPLPLPPLGLHALPLPAGLPGLPRCSFSGSCCVTSSCALLLWRPAEWNSGSEQCTRVSDCCSGCCGCCGSSPMGDSMRNVWGPSLAKRLARMLPMPVELHGSQPGLPRCRACVWKKKVCKANNKCVMTHPRSYAEDEAWDSFTARQAHRCGCRIDGTGQSE
eukprot:363302-Chlamydomonas_euryale.AAC.1